MGASGFNDPVVDLASVVELAKKARNMSGFLGMVRTISESDMETLKRLVKERAAVVKVLRERGVRCQPFDHDYKYNLTELIEKHFSSDVATDNQEE